MSRLQLLQQNGNKRSTLTFCSHYVPCLKINYPVAAFTSKSLAKVCNLNVLCFMLQVDVYVNKVGPFFNPHETYHYYQLPVCRPDKVESAYCLSIYFC